MGSVTVASDEGARESSHKDTLGELLFTQGDCNACEEVYEGQDTDD